MLIRALLFLLLAFAAFPHCAVAAPTAAAHTHHPASHETDHSKALCQLPQCIGCATVPARLVADEPQTPIAANKPVALWSRLPARTAASPEPPPPRTEA